MSSLIVIEIKREVFLLCDYFNFWTDPYVLLKYRLDPDLV